MLNDKRLIAAAALIKHGSRVADIGTDHGYLPIYLVQNGICSKVYACDLREKPLANATANIGAAGAEGIAVRLGNGLDAVRPDEIDTAVICGMGGEVIANIIDRAPWLRDEKYSLILQPMSSAYDLRKYLSAQKYRIISETAVENEGRLYTVMSVRYSGERQPGDPLFFYFGRLFEHAEETEIKYIKWVIKVLKNQLNGVRNVERMRASAEELDSVITAAENKLKEVQYGA